MEHLNGVLWTSCPTVNGNCTLPKKKKPLQIDQPCNHSNGLQRQSSRRKQSSCPIWLFGLTLLVCQISNALLEVRKSDSHWRPLAHHGYPLLSSHLSVHLPLLLPFPANASGKDSLVQVQPSESVLTQPPSAAIFQRRDSSERISLFVPFPLPNQTWSQGSLYIKRPRAIRSSDCNKGTLNCSLTVNKRVDLNGNVVSNSSSNSTGDSYADFFSSSWNIYFIWYSVFGLMIIIGLVANILVVATISGHKSLHTITNCFLLSLSFSDLLTLIFNANFNLYFLLVGHWPFGSVFCVVNNFISNLTIFTSVCTIMFTSKERQVYCWLFLN